MIVVDTSALMSILLNEPEAEACMTALETEDELLISAATVAEALIVAERRHVGGAMAELIDGLGFDVVPVTANAARRVALAYECWGKGNHPASLNYGDCFAYAVAKQYECRLLFVGQDFSKTDIQGVI
ncbi:type II toxin-antitoxin system VapC family toxin [Allochromatium humboldtianum]|uniref:Ribonuclease VapC n=1 Tax=Allochromatium humboldtianum TaxID=504901 RepID=A0A850RBU7_9GAMM|nr:type II toxin-antitoxin system VapC family toxin [Allochromatium humboldtianum]NVZ08727.1 type II toxin-antitoxin system VapC family toxin [Allochromatium humboldtianum]